MFKSLLTLILSGICMSAGLVSCSPDNKTKVIKDSYQAKPPRIVKTDSSLQLSKENHVSLTDLDLRDAFDFSASAAAKVQINSNCRNDKDGPYTADTTFRGDKPLSVFRLVHEEILTKNLREESTTCAFEVRLYNRAGSNHVYNFRNIRLQDENPTDIRVARDGEKEGPLSIDNLEKVFVRLPNNNPLQASLQCEDLTFAAKEIRGGLPFSAFDLSNPVPADLRDTSAIFKRPTQKCRVVIRNNNEIEGLSSLLALRFPLHPMVAESFPTEKDPNIGARTFVMNRIRIHNPDPADRSVRIVHKLYDVAVTVFAVLPVQTRGPGNSKSISGWQKSYVDVEGLGLAHIGLFDRNEVPGKSVDIIVPAGRYVDIPVQITYPSSIGCGLGMRQGHSVAVKESIHFISIDPQLKPDGEIVVRDLPRSLAQREPGFDPGQYTVRGDSKSCGFL
ncbi:MAG: hypothetical protein KF799_03875 [Bdellovibrionales bacterium]|nr:hypothetical protein [Bdellovibrionales bacterium]